uniref:Uncharacterized protein n=1 Tax=Poecilia mexicana TaxID=48701 RepID=A0A3B3YEQ5_9TELE
EDFQSSDIGVQQKAVAKADTLITTLDEPCRTKVNKTTVNTTLKDKGNEAYAQEDYETAVKCYSDGLAVLRDMQPLYTNRAQAYIKLERYEEAVMDCEWALKCNERCIKAYVHMGKAYLGLKNYNEARSCFEKILEIESGKESMVKEYLDLVDLEEEKNSQEMDAKEKLDKGERKATAVPQLLEKLSRPGQMPLYYCGGLESLSQAVTDCECSSGFVQVCFPSNLIDQELCVSVLKLWRIVCHENGRCPKVSIALNKLEIQILSCNLLQYRKHPGCLFIFVCVCLFMKRKGQTATKFAVKTLTVCTAVGDTAREELMPQNTSKQLELVANEVLSAQRLVPSWPSYNQFCILLLFLFLSRILPVKHDAHVSVGMLFITQPRAGEEPVTTWWLFSSVWSVVATIRRRPSAVCIH